LLQDVPENAADLSEEDLREGQVFWATVDSPWLHKVDEKTLADELKAIRAMEPDLILSSHLPMAPATLTERLLASIAATPNAQPFAAPDQAALEQMLKEMTEGG
jgi:hypothetical protein